MRLLAALILPICLAACAAATTPAPTSSEQALVRYNDEWRQKQALRDADAIMRGMQQARERREMLARSAR
jgi:hypothetical protein